MDQEKSEALARLWTEAQPTVGAYLLSLLPDFHQAEDALQQVAVLLVREFDKYDVSRPFLPWAMGVARNVALKSRREAARSWQHPLGDALLDQIEAAFAEEAEAGKHLRRALRECLHKQPAKILELLRWRYAHDLRPGLVATQMGLTAGAVRVMLHRAREVLRRCIRRATGDVKWS
jgi:RNA polymerase sigma-70 factor (ECF subfamily)